MAEPNSTVGQFAFAPATQMTTVTTTTTTTVSLEPFILKPPVDLADRDPKQFPLAFTPTPASMRRIDLEVGGLRTSFREADDNAEFLQDVREHHRPSNQGHHTQIDVELTNMQHDDLQNLLQESNGTWVRKGPNMKYPESPPRKTRRAPRAIEDDNVSRNARAKSPPSLAEAATIAGMQRKQKKPRSRLPNFSREIIDEQDITVGDGAIDRLNGELAPVTPDADAEQSRSRLTADRLKALTKLNRLRDISRAKSVPISTTSHPHRPDNSSRRHDRLEIPEPNMEAGSLAAATPPIMESDVESELHSLPRFEERRVPPPGLFSSSQQDASLPSPSLSPVTAAANLARSRALDRQQAEPADDSSDVSGLDIDEAAKMMPPPRFDAQTSASAMESLVPYTGAESRTSQPNTIMDVPRMIETFDSLPEQLQSYVMFHMLKRCSKRTLHEVAGVVNPALKCDPFDVLPVELSLKITKNLDGKSLCKAAQVSKRWRYLINSDEKAWKDLIDRDGFTLAEGELERAVKEGWGWQFPGSRGFEKNLMARKSSRSSARYETIDSVDLTASDDEAATSASRTRLKRKSSALQQTTSSKRQKRKGASAPQQEDLQWMRELEKAQGPIAYASAAAKAVPSPNVGLPSLSSLHLFKSIYQRHQMIRNTWIKGDSQPHHLAFRAHHRHVVTCLLFDSDRIITGSDDTSINVYDTKTGVLRKKLEGHEGGVWALSCDGDTLVSGSTDRSVRVWNIKTGECVQTFQGHTSTVRCLVILKPTKIGEEEDGTPIVHPEEPVIITGSRDSTLRVWKLPKSDDASFHQAGPPANDRDNPFALRTLTGHHNSVRAIAAHGDTLVSGSYDCSVRVWKISNGEQLWRLTGHAQKVYSVVLDHERNRCISGSMDNLVKVWSLDTGVCLFNLEGHTSLVGLLDLSHNYLVSAAADSTLRIWDPENGLCRSVLSAHTGAITCFQHDGQKVISGSDRTLKMWNTSTGECVRDLLTDLSGVWQVRFDERRCVAAVQRNNLTYIEVLDFGASRDGVPKADLGRRIVVDARGREVLDVEEPIEVAAAA